MQSGAFMAESALWASQASPLSQAETVPIQGMPKVADRHGDGALVVDAESGDVIPPCLRDANESRLPRSRHSSDLTSTNAPLESPVGHPKDDGVEIPLVVK